MSEEKEWIVTAIDAAPGKVKICMYEKHLVGEPGIIVCKELDLFELERLHKVTGAALWFHVKTLSP